QLLRSEIARLAPGVSDGVQHPPLGEGGERVVRVSPDDLVHSPQHHRRLFAVGDQVTSVTGPAAQLSGPCTNSRVALLRIAGDVATPEIGKGGLRVARQKAGKQGDPDDGRPTGEHGSLLGGPTSRRCLHRRWSDFTPKAERVELESASSGAL